MRRAPIVITATVLGTAGVLLFKPLATTSAAVGATSATDSSTGSSAPSSSESSSSAASSSAAPSASASTETTGAKDGAYTGSEVTTRFGTTQVRVTVKGGRITAVDTLQLNENDPRSEQISESAIPTLRDEVLSKQTAAVDTVSGATYTSLAYEASLQAALDKAGFTAADGSKASTATPVEGGH